MKQLIEKYNVQGPRYTSYPTVPNWADKHPSIDRWLEAISTTMAKENGGISLYIHLPYCERLCTYCGCNTRITVNHAVEGPYIQSVLQEFELYTSKLGENLKVKELHLGGGTPTFFSPSSLKTLIEGLKSKAEFAPDAKMSFECHPNSTTPEHLETLFALGFRRISIGVQEFNQTVQKAINRPQTFAQVKAVHDKARSIGFNAINHDLVYGLPFQKLEHIADTMTKVAELLPERIAFYGYAHVPWVHPGQRAYSEVDLPSGPEKRALFDFGRNRLLELGYEEIGMDHFALPQDELIHAKKQSRLHRNFMGYTTDNSSVLIGLGVSSISDASTAMVQNVKTVERYQEIVAQGRIPLFRGHFLDDLDQQIRRHIAAIMCQFTTRIEGNDSVELHRLKEKLAPMVSDGLVTFQQDVLRVTTKGEPFVRNVAMAFDRYLESTTEKQVYSQTV